MDIDGLAPTDREGVSVVSWESVQQKMLRRVARLPDGSPVCLWRTYDQPPL